MKLGLQLASCLDCWDEPLGLANVCGEEPSEPGGTAIHSKRLSNYKDSFVAPCQSVDSQSDVTAFH